MQASKVVCNLEVELSFLVFAQTGNTWEGTTMMFSAVDESRPNNITMAMGAWILLPGLTRCCFLPRSCSADPRASVENAFVENQEHTSLIYLVSQAVWSLALIGDASAHKTAALRPKNHVEAFRIRRLEGSRWRLGRTMGFQL